MKDINTYLNESLQNERIDEGFKDFIRKFAITAAVATSCLTAAAQSPQRMSQTNFEHKQIEIVHSLQKKYNTDDIIKIVGTGIDAAAARTDAMAQADNIIYKQTKSNNPEKYCIAFSQNSKTQNGCNYVIYMVKINVNDYLMQ
jgi:hypothetical protein